MTDLNARYCYTRPGDGTARILQIERASLDLSRPLLCVVDDEQWLDGASAQVIAFVARRLGAESIGLVFGTRTLSGELSGLPRLTIEGLGKADACALLDSVLTTRVDERIRDQIVAETRGNPLALVELPRELAVPQLAGGFGLPGAVTVPGSAEEMYRRRVEALPAESRRLLIQPRPSVQADPACRRSNHRPLTISRVPGLGASGPGTCGVPGAPVGAVS